MSFRDSIPPGLPADQLVPFASYLSQAPHDFVMCALQHAPTPFCTVGALNAFYAEFLRAGKLYVPLNIIMAIIFKGSKILKNPFKTLKQMIKSTLRSTIFLTFYVTTSWSMPCFFRNLRGRDEKWMYYVNGLLAGSMVVLEQPGRRLELAMYCFPRAVESLWNSWVAKGVVRNIKYGESIYFAVASGVMLSIFQTDSGSIHKTYRTVLHRLFGIN